MRPRRRGLDYFSHDCHGDDKLKYAQALHGIAAYAVYFKLLEGIYGGHGYYREWDEKLSVMFATDNGLEPSVLESIMQTFFKEGLFSGKHFLNYGILTSPGIQARYFRATCKREGVAVEAAYLLISAETHISVTETIVTAPETIIIEADSTQSIVKHSKVKHSKANTPAEPGGHAHFLQELISTKLPMVAKLKSQLTKSEAIQLVELYGEEMVIEVLAAMENYRGVERKYQSVYLTANNWCKRRKTDTNDTNPKRQPRAWDR